MQDNTLEDAGTLILAMHGDMDSLYSTDALDQVDTISIEELDQDVVESDLTRAGIAETTSVDKFIQMNGDTHHVERI